MFNTFRQSFRMSLQNIRANKMRSFLTMLGIIIGVGAVISLITIVQGVTYYVMHQFSDLGAGTMTIQAPGTMLKTGLTEADLNTLRAVDGVEGVSPSVTLMTTAVKNGEVFDSVTVNGHDDLYFSHNDIMQSGRLTAGDMGGNVNVCIVDETFIRNAMLGKQVLGGEILLDGVSYTVVGIRGKDSSVMSAMSDTYDSDGSVIIPYKNALTMSGAKNISSVEVYAADGASSDAVESGLRAALKKIYNNADGAFSIFNMDTLLTTMNQIEAMLTTMLGGIASIALVVGGIGIMNMMLVSVSERTKEIGLRKALGAEPRRIQLQFLIESVVLSVFGGIIGVILGEAVAYLGSRLLSTSFTPTLGSILLGLGFSLAVGVIFGWAPARRASRLNPIDALRSD